MTRVRAAVGSLNQTPLDWDGNRDRIVEAIDAARTADASVLCLPELCISGYGCEDAFGAAGVAATALDMLAQIVPHTSQMVVAVGLPLLHDQALLNAACVMVDGRIVGFTAKQILAGEGLHYEPRWFKPWPADARDTVVVGGEAYPVGDLVFDCGGVRVGIEICEDAWAVNRPAVGAAMRGADLILNLSASHFAFGKFETRKRLVVESSRSLDVSYAYTNLLGNEAGRVIYDGGGLIASSGQLLAQGPRLSFRPVQVTSAVIDVAATRMARTRSRHWSTARVGGNNLTVASAFSWPELEPTSATPSIEPWESSPNLKEEEFLRAVGLGLFDYLRKSRSHGFVVSLSGGADSSCVACLVALMVEMAAGELGPERFTEALGDPPGLRTTATTAKRVEALLHCVYQATRNSSETTRGAAVAVAEAIGARMSCLDIESLVADYRAKIEAAIGRELSWATDDLALQNIQARARAPGVWLLANLNRALLLATSNRSEAAVGYATMDGDTCGGLSPITGVDKAFLREWLVWLEKQGPVGLHPIPALAAVNRLAPTAELRPGEAHQTDEDDLMPYPVLDAIERAAIRDKQMPVEVFRLMRSRFADYTIEQLRAWVERFFRLWCQNQWKRERYAPSFHLDDENLDPKTWCRFPILSGGFQRELYELREYVARLPRAAERL
ncbi:MAG TPA: NAD(+) synthase [Planctomycetaceae bacterium]|nr:NAD(+) synthase [Planctomycetaceae bacterium]